MNETQTKRETVSGVRSLAALEVIAFMAVDGAMSLATDVQPAMPMTRTLARALVNIIFY